ncbi:uncharacterized protein LOC134242455, partial [Saccostrea cucullata]|uniref:uncharacterized protein LOC134242455 n=1 Tax=Saccostrea cuccullata TaxID=36930 RepID=UPI002ED1B155
MTLNSSISYSFRERQYVYSHVHFCIFPGLTMRKLSPDIWVASPESQFTKVLSTPKICVGSTISQDYFSSIARFIYEYAILFRRGSPFYFTGQKESSNQEMMLNKFQVTIQQLQEKLRGQEEALVEANRKLESTSREKYLIDTALNQIRLILVDVERRRGKPYFESDPVTKQVPGMLVHTLERFVQEMNSELDQKKSRITE